METYTTLAGEILEYPTPTGERAAFLSRVFSAAFNPEVTEGQLIELIYGREDPFLDQTIFPARGAVTKVTIKDPVYHVMLDLLDHKRVQCGSLDLERAHAQFTMGVPEVAEALGITPGAVRQAISAKRLSAIKKGGTYYVDPRSVDSFKVGNRGPKGGRS